MGSPNLNTLNKDKQVEQLARASKQIKRMRESKGQQTSGKAKQVKQRMLGSEALRLLIRANANVVS